MVGKSLGHYEIIEPLGAGGMGEVYRARDTKLDRDVAIKVLPEDFASDPDRLARFEREAKLLASLNHANIAAIYGLEDEGEKRFIAMELVEGETLAERISRSGRIELAEALKIARQITEALEAAHGNGVIHRDLKPANVIVTPDGKVKVLDFGLAKAYEADGSPSEISPDITQSPTMAAVTGTGVILGTAAYMSPEQARGKPVDKRADIWAFGCLLYELLAGRQAFDAETVADTLAAVLEREPDWKALPKNTPYAMQRLLRRCLTKDSRERLRDIGDARLEIGDALSLSAEYLPGPTGAAAPLWERAMPWALVVVAIAVASWFALREVAPAPDPLRRLAINLPPGQTLDGYLALAMDVSPDGTSVVYAAANPSGDTQLYLRPLDRFEATPVPGTEGGNGPFFSPNGQWVAFFSADGTLKKVSLAGGVPVTICDAEQPTLGGSWGADDTIIFAGAFGSGLLRVSAEGGTPEPVSAPDFGRGEMTHSWPQILPDGQSVIFTVVTGESSSISVLSLATGQTNTILEGSGNARYLPSGHLVDAREGELRAMAFDLDRLEPAGTPVTVVGSVFTDIWPTGFAHFTVSRSGSLAYVPGGTAAPGDTLVWVDRQGRDLGLITDDRRRFGGPRLSPDGERLAVNDMSPGNQHIWVYDLERGTSNRITTRGMNLSPVWMTDAKRLAFASSRFGPLNIFAKNADGTGEAELLFESPYHSIPTSWFPDGGLLVFYQTNPETSRDIWLWPGEGVGPPSPLVVTPFNERSARLSPDGGWLAYVSDESGRDEVYVRRYPGPEGKTTISTNGGVAPVRSGDGRELFYISGNQMMAVSVEAGNALKTGRPESLFERRHARGPDGVRNYDVSSDGQRFVMIQPGAQTPMTQINVVLNWFEELKQQVLTGR